MNTYSFDNRDRGLLLTETLYDYEVRVTIHRQKKFKPNFRLSLVPAENFVFTEHCERLNRVKLRRVKSITMNTHGFIPVPDYIVKYNPGKNCPGKNHSV